MTSSPEDGPVSLQIRAGVEPPDPFRWNTRPHLSRRYRVAGFNILMESNDERIIDAANHAFDPLNLPVVTFDRPDLRAQIMHHTTKEDPEWELRIPIVRTNGDLMTIAYSRHSSIAVNIRGGSAMGYLTEPIVSLPTFLRSDVAFAAVMCWIYVATGGFVHAAGLTRGGRSFLIRGPSGAGKSTLTYALMRRGYSLISEDAMYVYSARDPLSKHVTPDDAGFFGVPWQMHLMPDTVRFFPEVSEFASMTRPDGEEKLIVNVAQRFPGQTCPEAPAGPVIFLQQTGAERSRLLRLSIEEAHERLLATSFSYEPTTTESGSLWSLFLHHPVFLLESGADPNEAAEVIDRTFESKFS